MSEEQGQGRLLDRIFEHTLDQIAVLDRDFNFVRVSDSYARGVQRSPADLVGKNHFDLFPSSFQLAAEEVRRTKVAQSWAARPFEYADHPEWGETYWDLGLVPILDPQGEVELFLFTLRDVTARVRATAELRQSEARFRALFEQATVGVAQIDSTTGRFLRLNQRYCEIVGYSHAELCELDFMRTTHPPDLPEDLRNMGRLVAGEIREFAMEKRLVRKDGSLVWIRLSVSPLWAPGAPVTHHVAVVVDISEEKRAEEELTRLNADLERRVAERTAELERASRAKDDFLAAMSHELRTPLNAVLGHVEALTEGIYGAVPDPQRRVLRRVDESGRHLLELITDILDLSKIAAGRLDLELSSLGVDEVCRASLRLVEELARKKQIRLELTVFDGFARVTANERRLKQVLVNLLHNAVKFMPGPGTVTLAVDGAGEVVRFTVVDEGIGISPEGQARLFQPFVQLDAGLDRQHAGTGLGLALVRALVELMGGAVAVESEVGRGSRFSVTLPRARVAAAPAAPAAVVGRPSPALGAKRVLLVEDDESSAVTLHDFLCTRGHQVVMARNGAEALTLAAEHRPEVILMDIQMPVMDGLQAIRALRESPDPVLRAVPIVALTALAMVGDRERCLAAGADDYLTKPVSLRQLAALLAGLGG